MRTSRFLAYLSLACFCLIPLTRLHAAPYGPEGMPIEWTQPDGSKLSLRVFGDEFYGRTETLDGFTVVHDPATNSYQYAKRSNDGKKLVPAGMKVGKGNPKALGLTKRLDIDPDARKTIAKTRFDEWDKVTGNSKRWAEIKEQQAAFEAGEAGATEDGPSLAPPSFTTVGDKVGLTLLIDFSDAPGTIPQAEIINYLNGDNYTGYGNNGSVKKYFQDNSKNLLTYTNTVTAYVRMAQPKTYYDDITKDSGAQGRLLITDALAILKALPNYETEILPAFNTLTVDGSNRVVAFNVFFAGASSSKWSFGLWPHSWSLATAVPLSTGGKSVLKYQITNLGTSLSLGTFCHENGHMLCGYPDIYDYQYDSKGGAGVFCLMNSGGHGTNPVLINAYFKRASGWATTTDITSTSNIAASLTATVGHADYNKFYRYANPAAPTTEYFLFENRQKTGRDAGIAASGIAIWHIDQLGSRDNQSLVPNTTHANYECSLIQADNLWHFQSNTNAGDARDLYYLGNAAAGYTNTFTDTSAPDANWWSGAPSGLRAYDFSSAGATMTFQFGLPANSVSVLAPNGGENYYLGSSQEIRWAANITGNVKIELLKGGSLHSVLSASEANDGSYLWSVSAGLTSAGDYAIKISSVDNPAYTDSSNAVFSIIPQPTLADALDTPGRTWTTSGNVAWFAQGTTTKDGIDAAESGNITHSQSSSMETTLTGPGNLTFWWKVSSEGGYDYLRFYLNNVEQTGDLAKISGDINWVQKTVAIPTGTQIVKWTYSKDSSVDGGVDTAWVDQVVYSPTNAPEIVVEQPAGTNLVDGSATVNFGSVSTSASTPLTFTIKNTGNANLTGLAVTKSGANSADYTIGTLGAATLAGGASTTFTVTFAPGAAGTRTAAIQIASNDTDENPFDINLTGTGVGPGTLAVTPAGGLTSAGTYGGPFTPTSIQYTLSNPGSDTISWTAAKTETWFDVSAASGTLAPNANTIVTVSLNPTAEVLDVENYGGIVTFAFTNTSNGTGSTTRSVSLAISKAGASIALGNLVQTYTGTPKTVSVTTTPAGLDHTLTYNGSDTKPIEAGTYALAATITDRNYTGSATGSLVIGYAVTYQGNGNTGGTVPADQLKYRDVDLTLATNSGSLAKTGHTFIGWNTEQDGSGTPYAIGSTYALNSALTLYAQWIAGSYLTWDANGTTANQTNGAGVWGGANLWWNGIGNQNWVSGASATFGGPNTAGGAVTLAAPTTVENFIFNQFTGTYALGASGQAITINSGINKTSTSAAVTFASPITLGGDQTWTNDSSGILLTGNGTNLITNNGYQLAIDGTGTTNLGVVSNSAATLSGSGALVKNGTGRMNVGGINSGLTGGVTINGGVVQGYQDPSVLGTGNLTLDGGVLSFYWGTAYTRSLGTGTGQIRIPGGESGFAGAGTSGPTVNLGSSIVWGAAGQGSATGFFNPGKFVLGDSGTTNAGITTFSSAIDFNGATRTILVPKGLSAGGNVSTISGAINSTGAAGLIKEGEGTLILSAVNTYTGDTTISGGTLRIGNGATGTLNSGSYSGNISIASGATLQIWSTAAQTLSGTISGAGGLNKAYGGALTLSGPNTYSGTTSFLPQTTAGFTVNVSSFNSVNGGTPLMASSSLGAPATVVDGTIDLGSSGKQANVTLNYTGPGETTDRVINLGFNGTSSQTISASGSGLLKFTSAMTSNAVSQTGQLILSGTGGGEITQALPALPIGGLTKSGTGTWTLGGANAYAGPTTVSAGKLFLNGDQSLATGNVSVAASATLGGTGAIGGNTTIAANGRLEFNLSTPAASHDKLDLASGRSLTFSGASVLTITSAGGAAPGAYTLITAPGGIIGTAPSTVNLPAGWAATVSLVGNELVLNVTSTGASDITPPTLVGITDNVSGVPVFVNTPVTYTVTFNEGINASTVNASDFGNAGTASGSIGTITQSSPAVFSVQAIPTSPGTLLFRINAGATISDLAGNALNTGSALPDDTTITVNPLLTTVPAVVGLAQATAEANIVAANLVVGIVTTQYHASIPAGTVISQSPSGGTNAAQGSAVDLLVSLGPVMSSVPQVVGLAQAAAEAAIITANLTVGTVTTQNHASIPAGTVISQNPTGGATVAQGSAVNLVVSLGPVMVNVPNVVGLAQSAAQSAIVTANLVVGTVTTQSHATVPTGAVISQSPGGGASVAEGSAVNLVVSTGPPMTTVPDVVGQPQAAAESTILASNLMVGKITSQSHSSVPSGNVISQSPSGGANVAENSSVDLVISTGPATVEVPAVVGLARSVAESNIVAANLLVGTVTEQNHTTVPAGQVISQNPAGGTSVQEQSYVNLVVSKGPFQQYHYAESDIASAGTVTGTYTNTHVSDNVYQSLKEVLSTGNPSKNRYSYLLHKWKFTVAAADTLSFHIEANRPANTDTDNFQFAYSTTGVDGTYANMTIVSETTDTTKTFSMPSGISGTVHVRVVDTNTAAGKGSLDTLYIDRMYFLSSTNATATAIVPNVVGITQAEAASAITAATLTVGTITQQYDLTEPVGDVISQSPTGGASAVPASAVNLVVSLGPAPSTVTFYPNGGTSPSPATKQVVLGSTYGVLAATSRAGYTQSGWFTATSEGSLVTSDTVVNTAEDHDLYAQWIPNTYTVTYHANNATAGDVPDAQIKTYGADLTLVSNTGSLARSGYIFAGWNTATDGSGDTYVEGAAFSANADTILYAKWNMTPYTTWVFDTHAHTFVDTAPASNPDGDGLTNLQEFAFDTDPTTAVTRPFDFAVSGAVNAAGTPVLKNFAAQGEPADMRAVFPRRRNFVADGLTYVVEFSADLQTWTPSEENLEVVTSPADTHSVEAVSVPYPSTVPVFDPQAVDQPPKFFRVVVSSVE